VSLTPDRDVHSNVAVTAGDGVFHSINLNGGPASLAVRTGLGGGGGVEPEAFFEVIDTPLEPDPAVTGCVLSHQFAAPGARGAAKVSVENLGLAYTPVDEQDRSVLELQAVFIRQDGKEDVVAAKPIPELAPGELAAIELELEMPHQPVRLRVQIAGSTADRDLSNNVRECFFGAPSPQLPTCERIALNNEARSPAVRISWSNPALYDEVFVYRDGSMLATTSGDATSFIDVYAPAGPAVEPTYCVRGRIGVSKSAKAVCKFVIDDEPHFRRGDADSSGRLELTDAIRVLGHLFLGGTELPCPDAADADDNGVLQITDAVRILGYLFLGSTPPPQPGPEACGEDPTEDLLAECTGECR